MYESIIILIGLGLGIIIALIMYKLEMFPISNEYGYTTLGDLKNDVEVTADLFNSSKNNIKIVSGEFNTQFYNDEKIVNSIDNASKRGVNINLIVGPTIDISSKGILSLAKEGKIKLYTLPRRTDSHFKVIDKKNVYVETPHVPLSDKRNIQIGKNTIILGKELEEDFEKLKSEAKKIDKDRIIDSIGLEGFTRYDPKSKNVKPVTKEELEQFRKILEEDE